MNKYVALSFILGAAVGALGANAYLRPHYEQLLQEEMESIRAAEERRAMQKARVEARADIKTMTGLVGKYEEEQGQVIYDREDFDTGVLTPTEVLGRGVDEDPYMDEPYMISSDQYNDEKTSFDKCEIQYYEADGCLVDERDELVMDFMQLLGAAPEVLLADAPYDSPDVIYVRNEQMSADFEIQVNEGSWSDTTSFKRGGN